MLSPYIFAGIACAVFLLIFSLRTKKGLPDYRWSELAVFYLLMRMVPVIMLKDRTTMNYIALAVDIVILSAALLVSVKQLGKKNAKLIAAVYLFNPLTVVSVISGHWGSMLLVPFAFAAVYGAALLIRRKKTAFDAKRFFPEYIWICAGGFGMLLADDCLGQNISDMLASDKYPTMLVLSAVVAAVGAVLALKKLIGIMHEKNTSQEPAVSPDIHGSNVPSPAVCEKKIHWDRRNTVQVIVLTFYSAVAMIQLGSAVIPSPGTDPFDGRITSVMLGTIMVALMYVFAWKLSGRTDAAFLGGFLTATGFMHFTLSRISPVDTYVTCFILMMFFFMYMYIDETGRGAGKKKQYVLLLLCGISTGLACAAEWTGLYAAIGIAVIFFVFIIGYCRNRFHGKELFSYLLRLFAVCAVCFIAAPFAIYYLSSQADTGMSVLDRAISDVRLMLNCNAATVYDPSYSSEWYEWIIDSQPLIISLDKTDEIFCSTVAVFVNPLIAWGGIAAFLHNICLWRIKSDNKARFLVIAYLSMLMPWFFARGDVFISRYYVCSVILIIMIVNSVINMKAVRNWVVTLITVSGGLFVMFYPVLSGMTVWSAYTVNFLEWFTTWRFY